MHRSSRPGLLLLACLQTVSAFTPSLVSLRPRFGVSVSPLLSTAQSKGASSWSFLHQQGFAEQGPMTSVRSLRREKLATVMTATSASKQSALGALAAERYVVFTRLRMRNNGGLKWEKRWAGRKSTLSTMDGFRFFSMLRRCNDMPNLFAEDGVVISDPTRTPDYMSMTWWESKQAFSAWSASGAFQDSHGGGVFGWISLLVWAIQVLKGPPAPAKWEGLLAQSTSGEASPIAPQDRSQAGNALLPAECFVSMFRYRVAEGREHAFERGWEERRVEMGGVQGLVTTALLRRDTDGKEGGGGAFAAEELLNYSTCSVWRAREDFERWYQEGGGKGILKASWSSVSDGGQDGACATEPEATFWEGLLTQQAASGA